MMPLFEDSNVKWTLMYNWQASRTCVDFLTDFLTCHLLSLVCYAMLTSPFPLQWDELIFKL